MLCLRTLRAIEAGKAVEEIVPEGYRPSEKALALMSRGEAKHPFIAGIEDVLLLSILGISAGGCLARCVRGQLSDVLVVLLLPIGGTACRRLGWVSHCARIAAGMQNTG